MAVAQPEIVQRPETWPREITRGSLSFWQGLKNGLGKSLGAAFHFANHPSIAPKSPPGGELRWRLA